METFIFDEAPKNAKARENFAHEGEQIEIQIQRRFFIEQHMKNDEENLLGRLLN